ncbi:rho GTPase-activating protein 8-like, partial [Etheostoma cragini]|uniref:rho GTPase-activating protein 8-like n=1 Tax=Etheostoma cragini TaxID=417921 RepID=UPI00155E113C
MTNRRRSASAAVVMARRRLFFADYIFSPRSFSVTSDPTVGVRTDGIVDNNGRPSFREKKKSVVQEEEEEEEEEEEDPRCVTDAPSLPPSGALGPDASHPYYDVARHGIIQVSGDDRYGRKLITFSSCCLPPSHQLDHRRLLEYLKFTLDQYVEMDYILVYFHYGLRSRNKPSLTWLREAYSEFDRKYKKNLKTLYVVHPTNFIRVVWTLFKPLISHKFGKKLTYVNYLAELGEHLNYEQLIIPPDVLRHDEKLRAAQKGEPP